ncbi:hypothetical protein Ddc_14192 [Ditylenchus destructor]|nr:hypothetical protein Ddc_14192 [Ditylenchus destructor]
MVDNIVPRRIVEMGETKSIDRIWNWVSNKKNAAILASIAGIVASEALTLSKWLVAVKMSATGGTYNTYLYLYLETIWFVMSSILYILAFCGLMKERESIVLIFIFSQSIILFWVVVESLILLYSFISHPGCGTYSWPFGSGYCESKSTALLFQYSGYGTIIYCLLSCFLYRTIWRGYKFLKMANQKREILHVPIPAASNTSYVADNLSTAPEPAVPTTEHQNQSSGDWPSFFDHQKCVEHERNILG